MKSHAKILLATAAAAFSLSAYAADSFVENDSIVSIVDAINANGGTVSIVQSAELDKITSHQSSSASASTSPSRHTGYRIQVFSDNNIRTAKANAEMRKRMIEQQMPELRAYLNFESPYWRVRVGDFTTYSEADAAMRAIKEANPTFADDVRIVRERVNAE